MAKWIRPLRLRRSVKRSGWKELQIAGAAVALKAPAAPLSDDLAPFVARADRESRTEAEDMEILPRRSA